MTIWFSSDFHFNHKNICGPTISKWDKGFRNFSSLKEMNDTIIDNLNSKIKPTDTLYFLGDFAFGDKTQIPTLRDRIKCRHIVLHYGNHDEAIKETYSSCFSNCLYYTELRYKKVLFCNFHYAIGSWNEMHHGSINMFGHSHGTYPDKGRQMDCGVDVLNYQPISIDEVLERMLQVSYKSFTVDHHQ